MAINSAAPRKFPRAEPQYKPLTFFVAVEAARVRSADAGTAATARRRNEVSISNAVDNTSSADGHSKQPRCQIGAYRLREHCKTMSDM